MKIRPRDPKRGETDFLWRPKHRDPETRRSIASSPFEGRLLKRHRLAPAALAGLSPGDAHSLFSAANALRGAYR